MADLWFLAVGLTLLPMRTPRRWPLCLVAPAIALAMVLVWPGLWDLFLIELLGTCLLMFLAMRLISPEEPATVRRAWLLIGCALLLYWLTGIMPEPMKWLALPAAPILFLGVPVGGMLLAEPSVRRMPWIAPAASTLLFFGSWLVWLTRDHYQRLELG